MSHHIYLWSLRVLPHFVRVHVLQKPHTPPKYLTAGPEAMEKIAARQRSASRSPYLPVPVHFCACVCARVCVGVYVCVCVCV